MILPIFVLVSTIFHVGCGQNIQTLLAANQAANSLGGGGGGLTSVMSPNSVVQKCSAPVDHSCDSKSFNDIAMQMGGGGLMTGAIKGTGMPGGFPSLPGGLGRRRRGLFGGGKLLGQQPAPNPIQPNPLAPNPLQSPLGGQGPINGFPQVNSLKGVPGTNMFADPKSMGPQSLQNKLNKCDQNTKPGGQFDMMRSQLSALSNPQAMDIGNTCKQMMQTDQEQCKMLKRQCCAFMNGGVKDPKQLQCSFTDIMQTSAKCQMSNTACDSAKNFMKNPNDPNNLKNGANGVGAALVMNKAAGLGR